jgi:hypothetical protein
MAREGEKNKNHKHTRAKKEDNDKRLLMVAGVCFFMVLIGILWIFNLRADLERMGDGVRQSGSELETFINKAKDDWENTNN